MDQKPTKGKFAHLPAFAIDDRVKVDIEYELAGALGNLILGSDTPNTALLALGHQLQNLVDGRQNGEEDE
jgi:hypothetical protein